MNSRRQSSILDGTSSNSKPLSAWERRKLYSKQMYEKQRGNKNSENITGLSKPDSGMPQDLSVANVKSKGKRKLSLANDENAKQEKQYSKKHKSLGSSVFLCPIKKSAPKQKWQIISNEKGNSRPKRSSTSHFPDHQNISSGMITIQDSERAPSAKLRRNASFTIDKENETSTAEEKRVQNSGETQDTLSENYDSKGSFIGKNEGDSKPERYCVSKVKSHGKSLKSSRRVSLVEKKNKVVKPDTFSGKKTTQRRMTCVSAVLGGIKPQDVRQAQSNVKPTGNRRLSCADTLRKDKRMSVSAKPFVISSKPHKKNVNNNRLLRSHGKEVESNTMPVNDKFSSRLGRRLHSSNLLRKSSVAVNVEKSVANRKAFVEIHDWENNVSKNDGPTEKPSKVLNKNFEHVEKSIPSDHVSENQIDNVVSEYGETNCIFDFGQNEVTELEHNVLESERAAVEQTKNSLTCDTNGTVSKEQNDAKQMPHINSSHKKSVCFNVSLCRSTPSKSLPKTPKRDLTLRERLQQWLDNRGHSISSFRHIKCFGYHLSNMRPKKNLYSRGNEINTPLKESTSTSVYGESPELRTRTSSEQSVASSSDGSFDVDKVLAELQILLVNGHPTQDVMEWLNELVMCVPAVEENPQYWICCSLAAELHTGVDDAVAVYHKALDRKQHLIKEKNEDATFVAEICKAAEGLLRRYKENVNKCRGCSRTPHRNERQTSENIHGDTKRRPLANKNSFNSTLIKYGVVYSTPGTYKSSVKAVVTPVRRSARLSCTPSIKTQQAYTVLNSLSDLPQNIAENVLYKENVALNLHQ